MSKLVYVDNAATTQVDPRVVESMLPFFTEQYFNPSSPYQQSELPREAVRTARRQVADAMNAREDEIYFTSCGTESTNWAIKGAIHIAPPERRHIITTNIEHHATMHTIDKLCREGASCTTLRVNREGYISPEDVEAAITPETSLVSIIYANNEIGVIQPIHEIGEICRKHGILFHVDAVQAFGATPIDVVADCIDMLSISGHKFHAPKGIGALFLRHGLRIENLLEGGGQERRLRSGTENVPYIVGLGTAAELVCRDLPGRIERIRALRDRFVKGVLERIECVTVNGGMEPRLPGNINLSFQGIEGESMLMLLNQKGICASTGSACSSANLSASHVLLALGLSHEAAHGSLRFSFCETNTQEEVDYIIDCLEEAVKKLRAMSPLWNQ